MLWVERAGHSRARACLPGPRCPETPRPGDSRAEKKRLSPRDLVFIAVLNNKNESECTIHCKDFSTSFYFEIEDNLLLELLFILKFQIYIYTRRNYYLSILIIHNMLFLWRPLRYEYVTHNHKVSKYSWNQGLTLLSRDNPEHLSIVMCTIVRNPALLFHNHLQQTPSFAVNSGNDGFDGPDPCTRLPSS